jgi:hypothetical protein
VLRFGPAGAVRMSWVQQCLAESGVLFNGSFNLCARHVAEDVERALGAFDRACADLGDPEQLAGRLSGAPVRKAVRQI